MADTVNIRALAMSIVRVHAVTERAVTALLYQYMYTDSAVGTENIFIYLRTE